MRNFNLPSVVLREAWSLVPLDAIRDAVIRTISELGQMVDAEDEALCKASVEPSGETARRAALQQCTLELMTEAGLDSRDGSPPSDAARAELTRGSQYIEALGRYRTRAAASIGAALGVGHGVREEVAPHQ